MIAYMLASHVSGLRISNSCITMLWQDSKPCEQPLDKGWVTACSHLFCNENLASSKSLFAFELLVSLRGIALVL